MKILVTGIAPVILLIGLMLIGLKQATYLKLQQEWLRCILGMSE